MRKVLCSIPLIASLLLFTIGIAEAQEGEKVTIVLPEEPHNLEPGYVGLDVLRVNANIVEALVTRDPITGEVVPELATSWERIDEHTWLFKLRENVTFHNGEPFNAEAAAFAINRVVDPELNFHVRSALVAMEARAVDDYTLEIVTEEPEPILLKHLYWARIPAPEATRNSPDKELRSPVGTGPYMLDSWDGGIRLVLQANPEYWGGAPEIETVEFVWRAESSVRTAMVQTEEADIAVAIAPQDTGKTKVLDVTIPETTFLRMDVPSTPLNDIRIRRAINYAIDKEGLAASIFGGYAEAAGQLITPDVTGYNPDLEPWPYDPEEARQLIQEAKTDGVPIDQEITLFGRIGIYPNAIETMEAISSMLNEVGLNTTVQMLEINAWVDVTLANPVPEDRHGIIQSSHGNETGDAVFTVEGYYTTDGPQSPNSDPRVDELNDVAQTLEGEARDEAYQEILKYVRQNIVSNVPLVHLRVLYAVTDDLIWNPRPDNLILVKDMSLE